VRALKGLQKLRYPNEDRSPLRESFLNFKTKISITPTFLTKYTTDVVKSYIPLYKHLLYKSIYEKFMNIAFDLKNIELLEGKKSANFMKL
jgi:hypothetical protein